MKKYIKPSSEYIELVSLDCVMGGLSGSPGSGMGENPEPEPGQGGGLAPRRRVF